MDTSYHLARKRAASERYESDSIPPHRYVFVLTNKCNLDCSFCFQDRKTLAGAMTTSDWLALIPDLPANAWVTLTGGEPLAFKGFNEVTNALSKRDIPFNVISNGVLLNEELITQLLKNNSFSGLSISIDDIGNKGRDFTSQQWDSLIRNMLDFISLRSVYASKSYLDVKTVILDSNADKLFDIYRYFLVNTPTDTHSFQFLKGSAVQHSDKMFTLLEGSINHYGIQYERWATIVSNLEKISRDLIKSGTKKGVFLHPKLADLRSPTLREDLEAMETFNTASLDINAFQPCKSLWESVHINADGSVFPCLAIPFGNVKAEKINRLHLSERAIEIKDKVRRNGLLPSCKGCGYLLPVNN